MKAEERKGRPLSIWFYKAPWATSTIYLCTVCRCCCTGRAVRVRVVWLVIIDAMECSYGALSHKEAHAVKQAGVHNELGIV